MRFRAGTALKGQGIGAVQPTPAPLFRGFGVGFGAGSGVSFSSPTSPSALFCSSLSSASSSSPSASLSLLSALSESEPDEEDSDATRRLPLARDFFGGAGNVWPTICGTPDLPRTLRNWKTVLTWLSVCLSYQNLSLLSASALDNFDGSLKV